MIEYIEKEHIYLNSKGIQIPSVSELIQFEFGDVYKDVPVAILKNKARLGTQLHAAIEDYENKTFTENELAKKITYPNTKDLFQRYIDIKKDKGFQVAQTEQMVDWQERYGGRYDILTTDNDLIDIKTTYTLHRDRVALQLGLYYMALGIEKEKGYCMWLPLKQKGGLMEICVWSWTRCEDLVERYEEHNSKNQRMLCEW